MKKNFTKELIKGLSGTYKFCDKDINKFIFLLKKVFIHMNTWIAGKHLMKQYSLMKIITDFTDFDDRHSKRVFKIFNDENIGDCHDLYVPSDKLLLADVFENFRNLCFKIYELV